MNDAVVRPVSFRDGQAQLDACVNRSALEGVNNSGSGWRPEDEALSLGSWYYVNAARLDAEAMGGKLFSADKPGSDLVNRMGLSRGHLSVTQRKKVQAIASNAD